MEATPRRLSWEEMQRCRSLSLYFSCDDKFTAGHRCRRPQLLLLDGAEEEGDDGSNAGEPEISLHALIGWSTAKMMRIEATICSHRVIVLIDSGSTQNFISERVASMLKLSVISTQPFSIKVASDNPMRCQ